MGWLRRAAHVACALIVSGTLAACGGDGSSSSEPPTEAPRQVTSRTWVHEREFAAQPLLVARRTQTAVLDLEPSTAAVSNLTRYHLAAGNHRFCLAAKDPVLQRLVVEDGLGIVRATVDRGAACATVALTAGDYTLRVIHDATALGATHRTAFVRAGNVSVPIVEPGSQTGVPGWWAMRPLGGPTGKLGRVAAPPPAGDIQGYPNVRAVIADYTSRQVDANALFTFNPARGSLNTPADGPRLYDGTPLDATLGNFDPAILVVNPAGVRPASPFYFLGSSFIDDLGSNVGAIGAGFPGSMNIIGIDGSGRYTWDPDIMGQTTVQLLFRFFPDGKVAPALRQGEVALYQQCNYQGKATVFALDTPSFADLDSSVITLDKSTASIRLGNDTAVTLYSDVQYGGTAQLVQSDTPCLTGTPLANATRSIQVEPLTATFTVSTDCPNCQLEGVSLSDTVLVEADFTNANFTSATLARVSFTQPVLKNTNFSGATMSCTRISGGALQTADLTTTLFTGVNWVDDNGCKPSFLRTTLLANTIDPAMWGKLDLSKATFKGLAGVVLSSAAKPLDLTGVFLIDTDLTGAILDSAKGLAGADLVGTILTGGSLKNVDLSRATLIGTDLSGVNATGANLTGVSLAQTNLNGIVLDGATGLAGANLTNVAFTNAHLAQVDLSGTTLTGASFAGATLTGARFDKATGAVAANWTGANLAGASFSGVALAGVSMQGAILDGVTGLSGTDLTLAIFSNTSLKGVDLSGATLLGAKLVNTNLENANLRGANLSNAPNGNPPIRDAADLTGAHLKNVDLGDATMVGTTFDHASFYGSFANGSAYASCTRPSGSPATCSNNIPVTGATCSCATASGATMIGTRFTNAYLYGVDFSRAATQIDAVSFAGAILVGATFDGATFNGLSGTGPPDFTSAWLQGTRLGNTNLAAASLAGAFVDFGSANNGFNGNHIDIVLGPQYTGFKGWKTPNAPVCVRTQYDAFSAIPLTAASMVCPNGSTLPGGCGPGQAGNANWNNGIAIGQATPPGYYLFPSTFGTADQGGTCNEVNYDRDW